MIRYTIILHILIIGCLSPASAQQTFPWTITGGGLIEDAGNDIAIGPDGNIYVTGYIFGGADIAGTSFFDTQTNEMFLAKFNPNGQLQWVQQAGGGSGSEKGLSVTVSSQGNVYVAGEFTNTATFGDSTTQNTVLLTGNGEEDGFIASYTSSGTLRWAKGYRGPNTDRCTGVITHSNSAIYVTGTFTNSVTIGDSTFNSRGSSDLFLTKVSSDGTFRWAKMAGGSREDISEGIVTDGAGNIYMTGSFSGTATFGNCSLSTATLSTDAFMVKFSSRGSCQWALHEGGKLGDVGKGLTSDQAGNIYMTGYFMGDVSVGGVQLPWKGHNDVFLVKYDTSGTFEWVRHAGGSNLDLGNDVATDPNGNVYMTGFYFDEAAFGQQTVTGVDEYEIFTAKYSAGGNLQWTISAGGGQGDFGKAIAINDNGSSYITGWYFYKLSFGPNQLPNGNGGDVYVTKIAAEPTSIRKNQAHVDQLKVAPNPATDRILVQGNIDPQVGESSWQLIIRNLSGKTLLSKKANRRQLEEGRLTIATDNLSQGLYLVTLQSEGQAPVTRKVTILH